MINKISFVRAVRQSNRFQLLIIELPAETAASLTR